MKTLLINTILLLTGFLIVLWLLYQSIFNLGGNTHQTSVPYKHTLNQLEHFQNLDVEFEFIENNYFQILDSLFLVNGIESTNMKSCYDQDQKSILLLENLKCDWGQFLQILHGVEQIIQANIVSFSITPVKEQYLECTFAIHRN